MTLMTAKTRALAELNWQPITAPDRGLFLVTNRMDALNAHGYMSHVWITSAIHVGHEPVHGRWFCDVEQYPSRVVGLTHFVNITPLAALDAGAAALLAQDELQIAVRHAEAVRDEYAARWKAAESGLTRAELASNRDRAEGWDDHSRQWRSLSARRHMAHRRDVLGGMRHVAIVVPDAMGSSPPRPSGAIDGDQELSARSKAEGRHTDPLQGSVFSARRRDDRGRCTRFAVDHLLPRV